VTKERRKSLGRGLDALLREEPAASGVTRLPVDRLRPNRLQPRSRFDESGLEELAESIRALGVIQPIVAVPATDGGYTIVAGERRWRAAQRAGLAEVPVVVREPAGDRQLLELALVENLQRTDLNPIEEAEAYRALTETFGLPQQEVATRVGKARTTVTNTLRLLKLPEEVLDLLRDGRLTPGQARPLLSLDDEERQLALARRAAEEGLSARDLERLTQPPEKAERQAKTAPAKDVHTAAAEERLTRRLQAKVDIRRRGQRGSLSIHFHSEEELMRLFDLLMAHGAANEDG
jgi:ParB family chromosome partitioning protein